MNRNRDLLYFKHRSYYFEDTMNLEKNSIHHLLYSLETVSYLATCVEIIDLNTLKIIRKQHLKEQVLRLPYLKPFQFVNTLN